MSTNDNDKAGEARKGLVDTVVGKAKEVAGAVTGNDDLTQEGQLQQASAQSRKDANSREAIADAQARRTTDQLHEDTQRTAAERDRAHATAAAEEQAAVAAAATAKAEAEARARAEERAGRINAEQQADTVAAVSEVEAARLDAEAQAAEDRGAAKSATHGRKAADAQQQAAQLRAEAQK